MKPKITFDPPEMTREAQIAILEKQLADPETKARNAAAISRQISILKGDIEPGVYRHESQDAYNERKRKQKEQQVDPSALPTWWSEKWARYYVCCRIWEGSSSPSHWTQELDRCEAEWAASEGLTVEELREQIRREYSEHMQQYFPNGYPRSTAEWAEWNRQHPDHYEESQRQLHQLPKVIT